jgi:flagellar assembly factor FliW
MTVVAGSQANSTGSASVEPVAEADLPEIRFVRPVPGFPGLTRFVLVRLGDDADEARTDHTADDTADDTAVLYELRSLERPEVRFMVAVPAAFFPDYDVELDAHACEDLGLSDAGDALVLVVLTIGSDPSATTANLLAPVVVNARTRAAAQVILSGSEWSVRAAVA